MPFRFGGLKSRIALAAVTASLSFALTPAAVAYAAEVNAGASQNTSAVSEQTDALDAICTPQVQSSTLAGGATAVDTTRVVDDAANSKASTQDVAMIAEQDGSESSDSAAMERAHDANGTTAAQERSTTFAAEDTTPGSTPLTATEETVVDEQTASETDAEVANGDQTVEVPSNNCRTLDQIASDNKGGQLIAAGTYTISNGGKALDVADGSTQNGANVQLWDSNGTAAQEWGVSVDEQGYITLVNVRSGKALDVSGASNKNGTNVQQYAANGTLAQKWVVEQVKNGVTLRSALGNGLVLDVASNSHANGANVQVYDANGTSAQTWLFVRTALSDYAAANKNGAILAAGSYVVQSGDSAVVLDVASGSGSDGANVQVYTANGSNAQVWSVSVDSQGYVTLRNAGSGKVLDIAAGSAKRSQNVDQYSANGTGAQRWIVEKAADGSLVLHSSLDYGLVLDVNGGSTSNGSNVQVYTANGTSAQRWNFWDSNPRIAATGRSVADGVYTIGSVANGRVLDVYGGGLSDGADVQTYGANSSGAQAWRVTLGEDGFYTIRNAQSGRCLDVRDRVVVPGASLQQWGFDGQVWNIVADTERSGSYRIVSALSGLALTVSTGSADLTTAKVNSSSSLQLFSFVTAPAPVVSDGWKRVVAYKASGVLDVVNGSTSTGASVQAYSSNGTRAQTWWTRCSSDGSYTLQASNSGLYLTANSGVSMESSSGAASRWKLSYGEKGGYVLTNASTNERLVASGVSLWQFSTTTSGVEAGFYEIVSKLDDSLRLEVADSSKAYGGNVQVYASNGSLAQRYWIRSVGSDVFTITNCNSDLNLDVAGASTANGANIQQYGRNGTSAQQFRFTMGESGLEIRSVLGDIVLDVSGGSKANGTNVQVWTSNGTAAQAWVLKAAQVPGKMGWQNPSWMYQVSHYSVLPVRGAQGIFGYMSPSTIGIEATRSEVVSAFVNRAYQYLGTPYKWNYACAPGVGVDCVGLVMQCCYAVGMDLGSGTGAYDFNPYAHYITGDSGWHSHDANNFWNGGKGVHVSVSNRQVGDLVSWSGHIAIYIGNERIIEAPGFNQTVRISSLWAHGTPRGMIRIFA